MLFRDSANGSSQDGPDGDNQGFYFDNITDGVYNTADGTGNELANVITGNAGDNFAEPVLAANDSHRRAGGQNLVNGGWRRLSNRRREPERG